MVLNIIDRSFQKFDSLGSPFSLKFNNGSSSYTTCIGGCLSIFCFLLSFTFFVLLVYQGLIVGKLSFFITEVNLQSHPKIDLFKGNFYPVYSIQHRDRILDYSKGERVQSYVTAIGILRTNYVDYNSTLPKLIQKRTFFDFKNCTVANSRVLDIMKDNKKSLFWAINIGLCPDIPDFDQYYTYGSPQSDKQNSLIIKIFPCSLPDPAQCKTGPEFQNLELFYGETVPFIDISDKLNPIKNYSRQRWISIDKRNTKIMRVNLKTNIIEDTFFDFLPSIQSQTFIDSEKPEIDNIWLDTPIPDHCDASKLKTNQPDCVPYFEIRYDSGSKVKTIERRFPTILSILSEVGGLSEIMIIIAVLIYGWYNEMRMNKHLQENIIGKEYEEIKQYFKHLKSSELKQIKDEIVKSRQSATKLYDMMGILEILQEVIFKEHHRTLLPLLQMKRLEIEKKENSIKSRKIKSNSIRPYLSSMKTFKEDIGNALESLKSSKNQNELTNKIDEIYLKYLSDSTFKQTSLNIKSQDSSTLLERENSSQSKKMGSSNGGDKERELKAKEEDHEQFFRVKLKTTDFKSGERNKNNRKKTEASLLDIHKKQQFKARDRVTKRRSIFGSKIQII